MKDEIKEILEDMNYRPERAFIISADEKHLLLDYITNLQEENERLNNIIDELEKDINNQLTMTRKLDKYNEGFFNATLHYYNKLNELQGDNK